MLITILLAFLLLFLQGDTTVQTPTGEPTSWLGFALGYVFSNAVPLLTSWITKNYLNLRDTWYSRQSDILKRVLYVGGTTAAMMAFQALGLVWDEGIDILTMENVISKLVIAAVSTTLVALGIKTEQARRGVARPSSSSHIR